MNLIPVNLVFEDHISEFVMIKLLDKANKFYVSKSYSEGGFSYIKDNILGFNNAAKGCPFFVLTDLDNTDCAPTLIRNWIEEPLHQNLIFRVAVREVESWLLADSEGFSEYTGISKVNFSNAPDEIQDPKAEMMRLIKRCRKRDIREDVLPKNQYAKVGPNYNGRLMEFVNKYWSIDRAAKRSDSLNRAMKHLLAFNVIYN